MEFEWIATAVKYSSSLKSIELDYGCFNERLQDTHFMQMVSARQEPDAGFPLEIRTTRICIFNISDSGQQIEKNARFIRLKALKSIDQYGERDIGSNCNCNSDSEPSD